MSTLTADPRTRTVEPWMTTATADYDNRINDRVDDRVVYYGDEYDTNVFEDDLDDDPEALAAIERRLDKIEAEMAAGTWVGRSTEEVFAELDRKFPQLREFDDE